MSGSLKVLLIDDEVDIGQLLADILSQFGHQGISVSCTHDAEALLKTMSFDAVFSDIHMPDEGGLEFLERMQQKFENQRLPHWVFISGDGQDKVLRETARLGALDSLQKPFSIEQIEQVLQKVRNKIDIPLKFERLLSGLTKQISEELRIHLDSQKISYLGILIQRRSRQKAITKSFDYLNYFLANKKEETKYFVEQLQQENGLVFFEHSREIKLLIEKGLPAFSKKPMEKCKVWVPFCGQGHDLYSLALALENWRLKTAKPFDFEYWATDLSFSDLEIAQNAVFESENLKELPAWIEHSFFDVGESDFEGWIRVSDDIQSKIHFECRDLGQVSEQEKFDIIYWPKVGNVLKNHAEPKTLMRQALAHLKADGLFVGHFETDQMPTDRLSTLHSSLSKMSATQVSTGVTRVIVADDSQMMKNILRRILNLENGFEIIAEVSNGVELDQVCGKLNADVILLDINMPEMDGISWLEINKNKPHPPVVIFSAVSLKDASRSLKCFELGAVDYLEKPQASKIEFSAHRIRQVLKAAALYKNHKKVLDIKTKIPASTVSKVSIEVLSETGTKKVIAIGASTGGVDAITQIAKRLSPDLPPIVLTLHIPPVFSAALAERLNELTKLKCHEAKDSMILESGSLYIAPGGFHLVLEEVAGHLQCRILDSDPVDFCKPSINVFFESLLKLKADWKVVAGILTGMGQDGANGLLKLKNNGAFCFAQEASSCVVNGMPQAAVNLNACHAVLTLDEISNALNVASFTQKIAS